MTHPGGSDFNREVVEQIATHRVAAPREGMAEPAAQHLLGPTYPTDAAILAGELLKLDERLRLLEPDRAPACQHIWGPWQDGGFDHGVWRKCGRCEASESRPEG